MRSKILLLLSCIAVSLSSSGQVRYDPTDPFNPYSIGVNVGYSTIYGALDKKDPEPVYIVNLTKHLTSAISLGLEVQHGTIKSEENPNKWTTGLSETNQYNAVNLNARFALSNAIKEPKNNALKFLSNFYVGAGVGIVDNDITNITNKFKVTDTKTINPSNIVTSGITPTIPFDLGFNIYLKRLLGMRGGTFNVNYQQNYAFNDDINGYSFSESTTNHKYNAVYSVLSVGLSFYLGKVDQYK